MWLLCPLHGGTYLLDPVEPDPYCTGFTKPNRFFFFLKKKKKKKLLQLSRLKSEHGHPFWSSLPGLGVTSTAYPPSPSLDLGDDALSFFFYFFFFLSGGLCDSLQDSSSIRPSFIKSFCLVRWFIIVQSRQPRYRSSPAPSSVFSFFLITSSIKFSFPFFGK